MSELKTAALRYASKGFRVFPLRPMGKVPLTANGHNDGTTDAAKIEAWWSKWPDANIGLVAGGGFAVLDVDIGSGGRESYAQLQEQYGKIETRAVLTGSGGAHLYFRDDPDDPLPQNAGVIAPGLDIRAGGKGYVVAPPSLHESGEVYKFANQHKMAPVPEWLRELAGRRREHTSDPDTPIIEGNRNHALTSIAGTLRDRGLDTDELEVALQAINQKRCSPPLPDDEIRKIAESVARYAPKDPFTESIPADEEFEADPNAEPTGGTPTGHPELSDEWAVHRLLPLLNQQLRYVPGSGTSGTWYVWDGAKWTEDGRMEHERVVRNHLKRLSKYLYSCAEACATAKEGAPFRSAAMRFQSANGISAIVKLVRAHVACAQTDFDSDPDLLNTPTEILNLKTGEVLNNTPDRMMAFCTGVSPRDGAHPLWDKFLKDLTRNDPEMIEYLQRLCGYALTGDISEKSLFFIFGSDADTGKSTFIRVVSELFGTYHDSVDVSAFITGAAGDRIPADIARLPGKRLVTATEPAAGHAWDERRIKSITGGDEISARFLYGQWFTYKPQFKIAIVGNHEPEIRNVDDAMLRRIHIIPFDHKIPREKQVENLSRILVEREGPQILGWMLKGQVAWREHGLEMPKAVKEQTKEYEASEDTMGQWLQEQCDFAPEYEASRQSLFNAWSIWCKQRGEHPGTAKTFKRKIDARKKLSLEDAQVGERRLRGYRGIRLNPDVELTL